MPTHLLDINILSNIIRNGRNSRAAERIAALPSEACCTSAIVAAELMYGAEKKGSDRLRSDVKALLTVMPVLAFDIAAADIYARIRASLEEFGRPIGPNDMLIAAQARAHDLVLVTANVGEFARVPEIRMENWLV